MTPATIRVRRPSGSLDCFQAADCRVDGRAVHATGCWRDPSGRTYDEQSYTWPLGRVVEVRWEGCAGD